ncbi:hypothetical protein BUALT_Bualt18G0033700 [Buddleja alternifolia]|uniref:Uncharacterized protein n=1 Tax=Buddleja alternifolia TaxID=168488 RepID=A0AAV6WAR3_9LAMI|nr:hypothetical protein BUALT_Bualt18G0033700 [Buddleja alternifolia]
MESPSCNITSVSTVEPEKLATLSRKQEMSHDNTVQEAVYRRRHLPVRSRRRRKDVKKEQQTLMMVKKAEEEEEVEKKIVALQKIVPGGEALAVEKLFEETADYILELQRQVKALRFLTAFVQGSQRDNMKLGG